MKIRRSFELPEDKQDKLKKAIRLEWVTIFFLLTIGVVMFLTMGASQAMKTAWLEDMLSLIPPIAFLIAMRVRDREPTEKHPYGFRRAVMLSFLVAAVAILVLGLYMMYDAMRALLTQHHPSIGYFSSFGLEVDIWAGWVMIGALIYSMIPPVILGRMKKPLAEALHEKTLDADADMNKGDWMTAGAAALGVVGVGAGFWWADSAAAAVVSLSVLKDGYTNVRSALGDLMDKRPTEVGSDKPLGLVEDLEAAVGKLPGVAKATARLRENGHVVTGELFVQLENAGDVPLRLEQIADFAMERDWRLHGLVAVPERAGSATDAHDSA